MTLPITLLFLFLQLSTATISAFSCTSFFSRCSYPSAAHRTQIESSVFHSHHSFQSALYSTKTQSTTASINASSNGLNSDSNEPHQQNTIHLISIPPLSEHAPKIVRDVWKWKDIVLGDGRDYFVPRPRALRALSDNIVGTTFCGGYTVKECAILSNCARMDVLLSITRDTNVANDFSGEGDGSTRIDMSDNLSWNAEQVASLIVADCINLQLAAFQSQRRSPFMESVSSFLDIPGMVYTEGEALEKKNSIQFRISSTSKSGSNSNMDEEQRESTMHFASLVNKTSSIPDIVSHFSKVAAGMAPRASRPDRPVTFRPFSSRDAHIMLQLKRTAEVANQYPKVKIILDAALSAGKSARDVNQCPVLKELKGYDGEGKYSQPAPPQLAKKVAEEVIKVAIEPAVCRSVERLNALDYSDKIVDLRQRAKNLYDENDLNSDKIVKKMLHEPCMDIRKGLKVNVDEILAGIKTELKSEQN